MKKDEQNATGLPREGSILARPRALFVLLLLTSFLALALWALEMRPSVSASPQPLSSEAMASQ